MLYKENPKLNLTSLSMSSCAEPRIHPLYPNPAHSLQQTPNRPLLIQFSVCLAATPRPDDMPTPRPPPTESYVDSRFSEFRRKHKDDRKFFPSSKAYSFQRSAFLHGPPPSCSGAVSSIYIYISTYLQVGPHVGHRPTQCFSPSMLCVKSFYCHYLIFQFYGKSKCNKPLTHIQYSYYQYYYNYYNNYYYYHLPLALFFMFLSFRGMF